MNILSQEWFELSDFRRRTLDRSIWIPIYGCHFFLKEGEYPEVGHIEEFLHVRTAIIDHNNRDIAENLDSHDILHPHHTSYIDSNKIYHEANSLYHQDKQIGFFFAVEHTYDGAEPREVSVDNDFILALALHRKGDIWHRPYEGYDEVMRETRNDKGVVTLIEVKAEYLKDYLAARRCALRVHSYRERRSVFSDRPSFAVDDSKVISDDLHDRCELRCFNIDSSGDQPGAKWHMLKISRQDVDHDEDVPEFQNPTDENTKSETSIGTIDGSGIFYVLQGEMWREEWIEPADKSIRIGGDKSDEQFFVSVDGSGKKVTLESLNHEEIGKYLWFEPTLVEALLSKHKSHLSWFTKDTGGVSASPGSYIHFGFNKIGKINAYAFDVAKLSKWEQRIWMSHNCSPDGGVSSELLSAQMETNPAETHAPEVLFWESISWLDKVFEERFGEKLFREHPEVDELRWRIHRFRGVTEDGLRTLAKDITKASIERLEKRALSKALVERKISDTGTLKLLERLLSASTEESFLRNLLAPLHGVYNLRLSSAHLSSSDVEDCYSLLLVDRSHPKVLQASQILKSVSDAFGITGTQLHIKP